MKRCDKAALATEFGYTDTSGLRLLAVDEIAVLKGSCYLLFKNAENLTDQQRPRLKRLLEVNEQIHSAYLLWDHLKKIWSLCSPWAVRRALREWGELAEELEDKADRTLETFDTGLEDIVAALIPPDRQ